LEGELVAAADAGVGVVMLSVASPRRVALAQSDLDAMLDGVVMRR
jgi:hypothetical protein